jgi:AcrR family transcriptional regulator
MSVKPRRLDYVAETREALLDAAEDLFIRDGFAATSIDAISAQARFTKGAVYRHFADKQALFTAVFERVEVEAMDRLQQLRNSPDASTHAADALANFLDMCGEPRFQRIVLEEGPAVFGWRRWRELDQHYTAAMLEGILTELMDGGHIVRRPVKPLARLCCALIAEAAIIISEAENHATARGSLLETVHAILRGLSQQ